MTVGKASSRGTETPQPAPDQDRPSPPALGPGTGGLEGAHTASEAPSRGVGEELLLAPAPAASGLLLPQAPCARVTSHSRTAVITAPLRETGHSRRCPALPPAPSPWAPFPLPNTGPSNQTPSCFKAKETAWRRVLMPLNSGRVTLTSNPV